MSFVSILGGETGLLRMPWFVVALATGLAGELVVLVAAARANARARRLERTMRARAETPPALGGPPRLLLLGGALGPILTVIATVLTVQHARDAWLRGAISPDPAQRSLMIFEGLAGEPTAIIVGLTATIFFAAIGAVAAALAMNTRHRWRRAIESGADAQASPSASPLGLTGSGSVAVGAALGFLLLGVGPVVVAAIFGARAQLQALDATATASPELKLPLLADGVHLRTVFLVRGFAASCVGTSCSAVVTFALFWLRRRRARIASRTAGPPGPRHLSRKAMLASMVAVIVAGSMFAVAWRMRIENETPWPAGGAYDGLGVPVPDLEGPDELERGPTVEISSTGISVQGATAGVAEIETRLLSYRRDQAMLHRDEPLPRHVVLICTPEATTGRLAGVVASIRRAGFDHAIFALQTHKQVKRPFLGNVTLHHVTAARVSLGVAADTSHEANAVFLRLDDSKDCTSLSRRIVDARQTAREVVPAPGGTSGRDHQPGQEW